MIPPHPQGVGYPHQAMKNYKEHKVKDGKDSHKFEFSGADSFNNGESGVGERTSDEEAEVSE